MPSTLFSGNQNQAPMNNAVRRISDIAGAANKISGIVGMLRGKDGNAVAESFARINPEFREFYRRNWNRPVEDIAAEYGLDLDEIKNILSTL
jgi:folylpolyglutamate synthase/dihydropteroate synthase